MNRSKIRELAFELLYSLEIQKVEKESIEEQIKMFLETNEITDKKAEEYFTDVVYGIQTNSEKYKKQYLVIWHQTGRLKEFLK